LYAALQRRDASTEKIITVEDPIEYQLSGITAMLTFHVDSVEGAFTAIAPHVADVLPELANAREIVEPRIVGSVTREVLGGVHVERASFRFRRLRSPTSTLRQTTP
jgi:hypothetical protein